MKENTIAHVSISAGRPVSWKAPLKASQAKKSYFCIPKGELSLSNCLVNHIGYEVVVTRPDGTILFANQAGLRGLACSPAQIIKRNFTDFFVDRGQARSWRQKKFEELKRAGRPVSSIIKRKVRGKVETVDLSSTYMWRESGECILMVGREVTQAKMVETRLAQSEDRYRLLSEQAAEGILIVDLKGIIHYANKAAALIFRVPLSQVEGAPFEKFMDKSAVHKARQCFRKVSVGRASICSDLSICSGNGEIIPAEFTAAPVLQDGKIAQIHVIFRDVRARKEVEDLKYQSEKMKALHHFIAGTTSEIQLPLKGIVDSLQRLLDKYKDRQFEYIGYKEFTDIMKTLKSMNSRLKSCSETTDRLLSLSRRKAKLENLKTDVNPVIKELVGMIKHSAEFSDIKINCKLSSRLPPVAIGSVELGQVFNNILSNALQSLTGGGNIQVTTTYQKSRGAVRLDCQDDGVGISKEILPRIFEPFFTTKHRGVEKTAGLGLSIVYSIVKAHHGDVLIKSKFRQGTLVTVFLPVSRPRGKFDGHGR